MTFNSSHSCFFTVDNVMVAMERLVFKVVDPIQEFILRRLLGELQEVNNKSNNKSLQVTITSVSTDSPGGQL